jgi:hypothetical protein
MSNGIEQIINNSFFKVDVIGEEEVHSQLFSIYSDLLKIINLTFLRRRKKRAKISGK